MVPIDFVLASEATISKETFKGFGKAMGKEFEVLLINTNFSVS
jgi:hypothetical protein